MAKPAQNSHAKAEFGDGRCDPSPTSRYTASHAFAQCDMECRQHRNRELAELGEMSREILQVFIARAKRDGMIDLSPHWLRQNADLTASRSRGIVNKNTLELGERQPYHVLHHPPEA